MPRLSTTRRRSSTASTDPVQPRGDLTGAVLAGGASRRLGRDKALLLLPDGRPLVQATCEKAAAVCARVLLVVDRPGRYRDLSPGVAEAVDSGRGLGPLDGIRAALAAARTSHVLVVACDMPFLNVALLAHMAAMVRSYDALVPVTDDGIQPLHAIYSRACLAVAEGVLAAGERSVAGMLEGVKTRLLQRKEWGPVDPEGLSFFNLNRNEDAERMREIWRASG